MTTQPIKILVLHLLHEGHRDEQTFLQELSETERNAVGTMQLWSAKDHFAHRTFWHQHLINELTAALKGEPLPPINDDTDQVNATVFAQNQHRPSSEIYAEYAQTFQSFIGLVEQFSEEDLTIPNRFPSVIGKHPLYVAFLGSYEHNQEHLAYYHSDRSNLDFNLSRAIKIRENCAGRILQAEVPSWIKGSFLYNLAGFYAEHKHFEKANTLLQEAFTLDPELKNRPEHNA